MAQQVRTEDIYDGATDERSAGQLVKEVSEDMSTLVRKEIELAKEELGQAISAKIKGAVIFAVVGVLAFFMLIFLLLAIRDGFAEVWAPWIADLATVAIVGVLSGIAAFVAIRKIKTPISAAKTKKNIKEDVELVRSLGRR